jgi:heptosyltransferase I
MQTLAFAFHFYWSSGLFMSTRIAVFRFSALGDCVLLLAAVRALQTVMPDAKITWIIEHNLMPLFKNIEGIEFLAIKKPRSLSDYRLLKKQLADYQFDVLLAMQSSLRSNLLYPLIKAKRKIGFDRQRAKDLHSLFVREQIPFKEEHLLEGFMSFISVISGLDQAQLLKNLRWDFNLDAVDTAWATAQLPESQQRYLAVNPAASKPERCCSAGFYSEVLFAAVKHFDCSVLLTGGPASWEVSFAAEIEQKLKEKLQSAEINVNRVHNLVGKSSLPQLAALLAQVDVLLAPDTGPIHLADAMATKVVGLYAVAPPALTGPYQNQDLVVNQYPQALKALLHKEASEVKWGTRVHHPDAMSFFSVEAVLEKLDQAFKN